MKAFNPRALRPDLRQKVLIAFSLAVIVLIIVTVAAYRGTAEYAEISDRTIQANKLMERGHELQIQLLNIQASSRAFLLTKDPLLLERFPSSRHDAESKLQALHDAVRDNPELGQALSNLPALVNEFLEIMEHRFEVQELSSSDTVENRLVTDGAESLRERIDRDILKFHKHQEDLIAARAEQTGASLWNTRIAIGAATAFTVIMLAASMILIFRDLRYRAVVEESLELERNLLRGVIDTNPDNVFAKDLKGRFLLYPSHAGATDEPLLESPLDENERRVAETGKPLIGHEHLETQGGYPRWISSTRAPLRNNRGDIIGLVGLDSDITDQKDAQERLKRSAEELTKSNRELAGFASTASHDLQEPLRKIQTFGAGLRRKCSKALSEEGREYLERMEDAASRMRKLIEDLLKLSRVAGNLKTFERVDLAEVLRQVLSDLEARIQQTAACIEIGSLPTVYGEPVLLRQLFQNLLANALKFHKEGETPVISVSAKILENQEHRLAGANPGDPVCQVVVQDNGIGFEPRFSEKIFGVFQRLHSRTEYEGSGIGLALCRKITDRHGGAILAKGALGTGATFIVILPIQTHRFESV